MIRLVATDLDGTLVRSDQHISARSRDAIAALRSAGIKVAVVTGRPVRWIVPALHEIGEVDFCLAGNGAFVFNGDLTEILHSSLLEPAHAAAFARAIRSVHGEVAFAVERESGFSREEHYRERWPAVPASVMDLDELLSQPVGKLLVRHEGLNADELLEAAAKIAIDHPVTLTHSSTDGLLEVSALGVDKAAAVAWCAASIGACADDVLAFGDMPNDVSMLTWAGQSYAVANAHPAARAAAKSQALSNDEDGVATILESLL